MQNLALLYFVHYDCKILYNNKRLFNSSKSAYLLVSVELFENNITTYAYHTLILFF